MRLNDNPVRAIRTAANLGLWGTLFFGLLTVAEHYLAEYVWAKTIVTNKYTHDLLLYGGWVLVVLVIAIILFTVRRQIPRIRQLDAVEEKLDRYKGMIQTIYYTSLIVSIIICSIIVITHENTLLMLLLLHFFTLALCFPNMYKLKVDCGLNDQDMKDLFGDSYISDNRGGNEDAAE